VEVVSARPTLSPFGPVPRLRSLPVAGIFRSGRTERIERLALPLTEAARLLPGSAPRLEVATAGLDEALAVAARLRAELPAEERLRTWQDLNRPLFFALRLERSVMFAGVFLIVVVAALALVADLALVQSAKWREVGALAAMGASGRDLGATFTLLGGMLAGLGALAGGAVGTAAAWLLDRHRLVRLPRDVYFLDYLPFSASGLEVAGVMTLTVALAVAFSAYAARRAALSLPAEAIRR
jgi:lipoprotein-releasing system permease protein